LAPRLAPQIRRSGSHRGYILIAATLDAGSRATARQFCPAAATTKAATAITECDRIIHLFGREGEAVAERRLGAFPLTTSRPWSACNRPVLCFLTPISASGRAASGSAAGEDRQNAMSDPWPAPSKSQTPPASLSSLSARATTYSPKAPVTLLPPATPSHAGRSQPGSMPPKVGSAASGSRAGGIRQPV
jgi:hypothetical protein